jgi:hypothetical protein
MIQDDQGIWTTKASAAASSSLARAPSLSRQLSTRELVRRSTSGASITSLTASPLTPSSSSSTNSSSSSNNTKRLSLTPVRSNGAAAAAAAAVASPPTADTELMNHAQLLKSNYSSLNEAERRALIERSDSVITKPTTSRVPTLARAGSFRPPPLQRSYSSMSEAQRKKFIDDMRHQRQQEDEDEEKKKFTVATPQVLQELVNQYGTKMAHLVS